MPGRAWTSPDCNKLSSTTEVTGTCNSTLETWCCAGHTHLVTQPEVSRHPWLIGGTVHIDMPRVNQAARRSPSPPRHWRPRRYYQPRGRDNPNNHHRRGSRRSHQRSTATWGTLDNHGHPVAWSSSLAWHDQPRPLTVDMDAQVPEPFRGFTLNTHRPANPPQSYTEDERRLLCPLCEVPEIHRRTHRARALHRSRESAAAARAAILHLERMRDDDLARAIAFIRRLRPALLRPPSHADPSPPDAAEIAINIDDDEQL
ncbi:uncharacterized protein LOC121833190 [Ixodes scapularis]|uniref:uncharacterized protein LOC121833190 n=1 Tax=Ixodes scapularis TaxID=6945 RepID=UPI001C382695|nr:uncharacterized protein LOC121833190 [Ixodes scapularis]